MSNLIIANRKIYLTILSSYLGPLIYQGFESIYDDADKISNNNNVLKNYQSFLKKIPNWSNEILENEKNRILVNLNDQEYIFNLIKLIIKYTLIQLTLNQGKIILKEESVFNDFDFKLFLHKIYIESAREIYLNPFLCYNKLPSIEIKKNQNMVLDIIKDKIEKVILELLPLDEIIMRNLIIPFEDYETIISSQIPQIPQIPQMPQMPQNGGNNPDKKIDNHDIKIDNPDRILDNSYDKKRDNLEKTLVDPHKDYSEKFISASKLPHLNKDTSTQDEILNIINEVKQDNKPFKLSDISETSDEDPKPKIVEEKVINLGGGKKQNSSEGLKQIMNELKNSNRSEEVSFVPPSENESVAEIFTNNNKDSPTKKLNKNKFFTNYLKV